jgi:hypothetical protein
MMDVCASFLQPHAGEGGDAEFEVVDDEADDEALCGLRGRECAGGAVGGEVGDFEGGDVAGKNVLRAAQELVLYSWDGPDVVYPRVAFRDGDVFHAAMVAEEYSHRRVEVEDWLPRAFLIRTKHLRGHSDYWSMWKALDKTCRFKACFTSTFIDDAQPFPVI